MSAPVDWHSPLRCPLCRADAGHPFSVQSKSAREIVVAIRCHGCAHEWTLERETPTLTPKFDQRYSSDDYQSD